MMLMHSHSHERKGTRPNLKHPEAVQNVTPSSVFLGGGEDVGGGIFYSTVEIHEKNGSLAVTTRDSHFPLSFLSGPVDWLSNNTITAYEYLLALKMLFLSPLLSS